MTDDQFHILYEQNNQQSAAITKLLGEFKEFKGGMDVRVEAIEDHAKSIRLWGHIETVVVIPIIAIMHQAAAHLGWIK
jgi:hypothetical protein